MCNTIKKDKIIKERLDIVYNVYKEYRKMQKMS